MEGDKEYAEALTAKRGGQCIFADYIYGVLTDGERAQGWDADIISIVYFC